MEYQVVLLQKNGEDGLKKEEVIALLDKMQGESSFIPIEVLAEYHECSAQGFISTEAADLLDYDYEGSGFSGFIANILDDVNNENDDNTYVFKQIKIWLGYTIEEELYIESLKSELTHCTPVQLHELMSETQKDHAYRKVWESYVIADVKDVLSEREICDTDDRIACEVASLYVYNGDYDCNLNYWDNINILIDNVIGETV